MQVLSRTSNFTDDDAEAYRSYYYAKDVLAERASARGLNQILTNSDLISDAAWVETEIYRGEVDISTKRIDAFDRFSDRA